MSPQAVARLTRDALVITGVVAALAVWGMYTFGDLGLPVDAHYYWAANPAALYPHPELAEANGYNYSPAFELVAGWGRLLPFEVFVAIWRAILLAALVYLARPLTIFVLFLPPVASEINAGNIQILLALAIALGFRWPSAWALVLLTKVSPGVGLLWFMVRREWWALATALGVTVIIALVALLLWWDQWPGYVALITSGEAPSVAPFHLSLYQRLPFAVGTVLIGAWRGWRWTVPVAATVALPVFYFSSLSMLVGVLPYVREWLGKVVRGPGWLPDATQDGAGSVRQGPDSA